MRILTCALLPSLAWMALASGLTAEEIKRDFHESFDVSQGARLRLRHGDGDVDIRPWDKNVLDIEVHYHADISSFGLGRRRHPDFTVDFSQRGDQISVVGRRTGHGGFQIGFFSSRRYEYTYTIRGPAYLELELEGGLRRSSRQRPTSTSSSTTKAFRAAGARSCTMRSRPASSSDVVLVNDQGARAA